MKEYIISPSQTVTGYIRSTSTRTKTYNKENGTTTYGSWSAVTTRTTVSHNTIKKESSFTETLTSSTAKRDLYQQTSVVDRYKIDMTFDVSSVPANKITSVKLRGKLTNKNNVTPLGYEVWSTPANAHFSATEKLGSLALGLPNLPYEHDITLSGLSSTGWYSAGVASGSEFDNNEVLTFDNSSFVLVIVTDEEGTETTHYKTAKVRLPAGTYTAFVAVEGESPLASLIKTSADVFVHYYDLEEVEKLTFTLTAECDVWVSTTRELVPYLMIVSGEERTNSFIPYGETTESTYIKNFLAEEVVGYIPTTGVNGHYEYDELNDEGTNTPGSESNPGVWVTPFLDEQRNLIQTQQINTFTADGIHDEFYLLDNNSDVQKVEFLLKTRCKNVNGEDVPTQDEIGTVDEGVSPNTGIRYYYKHIWTEIDEDDATYGWETENATASGNPYATKITFDTEPPAHEENLVNIRVTYIPLEFSYSEAEDAAKIRKCSVVGKYGYFNNNRFYFTGNPNYKGMDFESGVDDPTYFPANGWTQVGSKDTAIQGYSHYGEDLAIIKEDNNIDATVYMRTAHITDESDVIFPVKQGAQGVGALSKFCLKTLHDEPLFLAKEGVYAIQGTDASQERTVPNRSAYIDVRLRNDVSNLCVAETFKDYYILVNPVTMHAYVADWRRSSAQLEWCVWDNIPASVLFATDDQLFFGTRDGKLCVFNFDFTDRKRYLDGLYIDVDEANPNQRLDGSNPFTGGEAINAYYVTKRDYLGTIQFKKTMLARGGQILVMPFERSSAAITLKTDKGEWFVDDIQTDSDEPAVVIPIRMWVKNFDSIETRIENKKPGEGLAILSVQYSYAITTDRR